MSEFQKAYRRGERNMAKRLREAAAEIERLRALVLTLSEANRRYSKAVSRETAEMIEMEGEQKP